MNYRAAAGVGTSKRLILKGETISEKEYNGLSDRHKNKFVLVNPSETKEPPNRNEAIGDQPDSDSESASNDESENDSKEDSNSDENSDADKTKTKEPPKRKK